MTADDLDVDLDDQNDEVPPRSRPGEWLEYSRILPVLAGADDVGLAGVCSSSPSRS